MNWPTFVNENLYFARLQLDASREASSFPWQKACEQAAVLLLEQAYVGFLNELAHKRRVKERVETLEELEAKLGVESAEISRLKAQQIDGGWLEQLKRLRAFSKEPQQPQAESSANIIAVSSVPPSGGDTDLNSLHAAMKETFSELRDSSTEW